MELAQLRQPTTPPYDPRPPPTIHYGHHSPPPAWRVVEKTQLHPKTSPPPQLTGAGQGSIIDANSTPLTQSVADSPTLLFMLSPNRVSHLTPPNPTKQ